jgi:hypothetical protein
VLYPIVIFYVRHGQAQNAFNVPKEPTLMKKEFVLQLAINVTLLIKLQETA